MTVILDLHSLKSVIGTEIYGYFLCLRKINEMNVNLKRKHSVCAGRHTIRSSPSLSLTKSNVLSFEPVPARLLFARLASAPGVFVSRLIVKLRTEHCRQQCSRHRKLKETDSIRELNFHGAINSMFERCSHSISNALDWILCNANSALHTTNVSIASGPRNCSSPFYSPFFRRAVSAACVWI